MGFSTTNIFRGKLDGIHSSQLLSEIDYNMTRLEDRVEIVETILNSSEFFDEYFEGYFKVNVNTNDPLSHEINVCGSLEKMADYILNSDENKEYKKSTPYMFYSDEKEFKKKLDREASLDQIGATSDLENVIHFLKRPDRNYRLAKVQKIKKSDLERKDEVGEVLKAYNDFLEKIKADLKNYKEVNKSRYILSKAVGQIKEDMIQSKDMLLGTFGYNTSECSYPYDWDITEVDYSNENHVKWLLSINRDFSLEKDLSLVILDFEKILTEIKFTEKEQEVVILLREGRKYVDIAKILNCSDNAIKQRVINIVDKIVAHEEQKEYIYWRNKK